MAKTKTTYIRYSNLSKKAATSNDGKNYKNISKFKLTRYYFAIAAAVLIFSVFSLTMHAIASDRAAALAQMQHVAWQKQEVAQSIGKIISNNPNISFSISLSSLNSDFTQSFGESSPMDAASVGKLFTATMFLHEVETGRQKLNGSIDGQTAKYDIKQLINQSDDSSWAALNSILGHQKLLNYAQSIGINTYDPSTNTVSSKDIGSLLQQLYEGKLLNKAHTQLLLSYMQNTNYEQFITPAVPPEYAIYHKVGLINDNVNDSAIISNGNKTFVLVIFTDGHGAQNWEQRAQLIQQITKSTLKVYSE